MTTSIVSRNIQTRMKTLNINTRVELAKLSGVSRTVITNALNKKKKKLMADSVFKLSQTLQCSVEWLLTNTNGDYTAPDQAKGQRVPIFDVRHSEFKKNQEIHSPLEAADQFAVLNTSSLGSNTVDFYSGKMLPASGDTLLIRSSAGGPIEKLLVTTSHGRYLTDNGEELNLNSDNSSIELVGVLIATLHSTNATL